MQHTLVLADIKFMYHL